MTAPRTSPPVLRRCVAVAAAWALLASGCGGAASASHREAARRVGAAVHEDTADAASPERSPTGGTPGATPAVERPVAVAAPAEPDSPGATAAPPDPGPSAGVRSEAAAPAPSTPAANPTAAGSVEPGDLASFERALAAPPATVDPAVAEVLATLAPAVDALQRGAVDTARTTLDDAVKRWPDHPAPLWFRARLALAAGQLEDARADLDGVVARGGHHPMLEIQRARLTILRGDFAGGERVLREELAEGDVPVEAAIVLVQSLLTQELHGEALAVLAAAQRRVGPNARLARLRLLVLQETWDLDAAEATAATWLETHPDDVAIRWSTVDLARARGDLATALARLDALEADAGPEVRRMFGAEMLAGTRRELTEAIESGRPMLTPQDLLAQVRGATNDATRLQALQALLATPQTRAAAIRVGWQQSDLDVLRVTVVRAFDPASPYFRARLQAALGDPSPAVRASAAKRIPELPTPGEGKPDPAIRLLLAALDAEEDDYAFEAVHRALTARVGARVRMPLAGARDPEVRSRIRNEWRQICPE